MSDNIPEGYLPLFQKMCNNLNDNDLLILLDIANGNVGKYDKKVIKNLVTKMTSSLSTWEKMKVGKMFLRMNIK